MYTVVFSDRDGTMIEDEDYYLGSNPNWRDQVSFLEGVVEGVRLINTMPNSHFFILTNQSGVALQGEPFDNLTIKRMHEVNKYVIEKLQKEGLKIDGYFACPYVDHTYVEKSLKKGRKIDPKFTHDDHPDLKPNIGMIEKALKSLNLKLNECNIYSVGDRATDVELGIRAGGMGILVESYKTRELGDKVNVLNLQGKKDIAKDFFDAAKYIYQSTLNIST